jgi:ectoine hydroxylase-related dioxygenase (phytanoyl-CoA dioxygenase family)
VWNLFACGPAFCDLLLDGRLRGLCTALLGTGYVLSDYSLNAVYPGAAQDPWHTDHPYNEMDQPVRADAPLGLQCVIALDDFDRTNGATEYVPGSHQRPPPIPVEPGEVPVERFDARPGDLLAMHAATWHRAGLNTSGAVRTGMVLSFMARWVRPIIAPRDIAEALHDRMPEELRILLGAVVLEQIDSAVVRREVV